MNRRFIGRRRLGLAPLAALLAAAALAAAPARPAVPAADGLVLRAAQSELPALERAVGVGVGDARLAQGQYDAARALEGVIPPPAAVSRGCRQLARDLQAYLTGILAATQGVDRLERWRVSAGQRFADRALARLDAGGRTCRPTARPPVLPRTQPIDSPRPGEAFYGEVVDRAAGDEAALYANGRLVETVRTAGAEVRFRLRLPPGRYNLELEFRQRGRVVARSVSPDVFLLREGDRVAARPRSTNGGLNVRLGAIGRSFAGYAAAYVLDLRTGRTAGWNADALFPAASTVKLGVAVAALRRWAPNRPGLRLEAELRALTGWSSNLAANRLVTLLGNGSEARGAAVVTSTLRRLGATRSTYPQGYRVGTDVDAQPPLATGRLTTARDLGTVMRVIAAAAGGDRAASRRAGLSSASARYLLGLLLRWERAGNNNGVIAPALPPRTPIAQKSGWITTSQHTAAIVFAETGPKIIVVLTHRDRLARRDAVALGRQVVHAALGES